MYRYTDGFFTDFMNSKASVSIREGSIDVAIELASSDTFLIQDPIH